MCRETGTGTETGNGTGTGSRRGRELMKIQDDARDKKTHRRRRQQSARLTVWQPGEAGTARGERGTGDNRSTGWSLGQLVVQLFLSSVSGDLTWRTLFIPYVFITSCSCYL